MRARVLRALGRSGQGIGLGLVFVSALGAGVVLHTNTPAFRRIAASIGNAVMGSLFQGKIVVRDVRELHVGTSGHLRAAEVRIVDPDGHDVIVAHDVDAEIDLLALAKSKTVDIRYAKIGEAHVVLDRGADGELAIARTFATRSAAPPSAPTSPAAPSTTPAVHVRSAEIGKTRVRGNIVPPALEGEAKVLAAHFDFEREVALVTVDDAQVVLESPRAPNQRAPIAGKVKGTIAVDVNTTRIDASAELVGAAAEVPVTAHAEMHGDDVEATVDVATVEPAKIATAFSDLPLTKPVSVHAVASGRLPTIAIEARARVGDANVTAKGEIDTGPTKTFKLDVDAAHVDADAFGAGLTTDVSGKAHAEGTLANGPDGTFRVTTESGSVGGQRIPATTIEGRGDGKQITAVVRASEPGVEATGRVTVDLPKQSTAFDLQARSYDLKALVRAPGVASGAASVRVQGSIDHTKKTIQAMTTASADNVAAGGFGARHVNASGTLAGPIAAPELVVGFAGVDVQMQATGKTPLVYPSATGHARVTLGAAPRIRNASITVAPPNGEGEDITASAESVSIADGSIEARGLRVTGLGEPLELDARVGNGTWAIRAKGAHVNVHRAATVTGIKELELLPPGTDATLDVDVRQGAAGADGHIDLLVRNDKGIIGTGPFQGEIHATLERGRLVGTGRISAEGFATIEITEAAVDIPGRLDARSLKRATGVVEVRGSIDLARGAALFAGESVESMAGIASFEVRAERGSADALPALRGTVRTDGLVVVLSDEDAKSTTIAGIDLQTHVAWDGRTNDAEASVVAWDRRGLLASGGTKARIPLVDWLTGAVKFGPQSLADLDIDAVVDVPSRELTELPAVLTAYTEDLRGQVGGTVRIGGTVGHPHAVVSTSVRGLHAPFHEQNELDPLDGSIEARWDGEQAVMTFAIDEVPRKRTRQRKKKTVPGHLRGMALVADVRMRDLLHGQALTSLPWRASGEFEVENLNLNGLSRGLVSGMLTGRASIKELNRDPSFEVKAHVDDFGAGGAKVQSVDVAAGGRDASLYVHGAIVDKKANAAPSQITLQLASAGLRMKGIDFGWEPQAATRLDYIVQNGNLSLFAPLVKSVISEIDGRVDGTGSVTIKGDTQTFDGGLAVQNASIYANVVGEEITNLRAIGRFERSGIFRIDEASGKIASGEFRASATGRMKGLQLMEAQATVLATRGVPISFEGATFAEATGEVKIAAKVTDDRKQVIVTLELPRADVSLPDRGTQSLQPLDPDTTIAVGVRRRGGELDTTAVRASRGGAGKLGDKQDAKDAVTTKMTVTLGNDVHLQGRGLDVNLGGRTLVDIAEEVNVSGQIDLRGGSAVVHGRRFNVDRGTVTFYDDGDPTNPMVVASAYWDSPDRTRVWVEFVGPLKSGKLTLRSEPPYSKNEILSVLIFGRADPNMAQASSSGSANKGANAGGQAASVGGGFIAGDLNRVLSEIDEDLDVETDTLSGNRARAKVGRTFFDRRLKVQVGYAPGQTFREPDTQFLFLTWQFIPKWSLLVTRGNKGTSILDVLFQHRY